jgi:hypothetical protein
MTGSSDKETGAGRSNHQFASLIPGCFMTTKQPQPRPSAKDAARRLLVLKYVVVYALTAPPRDMLRSLFQRWDSEDREKLTSDAEARREEFWHSLRVDNIWESVSSSERELAGTTIVTMSPQQQVNASWRIEAAQVLMWALGLIAPLPPYDNQASHDLLNQIPSGDMPTFVLSAHLRNHLEIERARADAELWHWRSRTRQLIEQGREFPANEQSRAAGFNSYHDIVRFTARKFAGEGRMPACIEEDFPAKGKAYRKLSAQEWSELTSITMERHFALNWLCGYAPGNDWDKTPGPTLHRPPTFLATA